MRMSTLWVPALLFAACAFVTLTADDRTFFGFPIAEPPFTGQLAGIDREANLSFKTDRRVRVMRSGDLAYWGQWHEREAGPQLLLKDGGILHADLLLLGDQHIVVGDASGLGRGLWDESTLPRQALLAIVLQSPAGAADRDRLELELQTAAGPDDRMLLRGGDELAGRLIAAPRLGRFAAAGNDTSADTFQLLRRGRSEPIAISPAKVVAVQFAAASRDEARSDARPNNPSTLWLGFNDGSLLRSSAVTAQRSAMKFSLAAGGELKAVTESDNSDTPFWDAVTYVESANSRVTWLSDVTAAGFKHTPFVSIERPFKPDRCVLGTRLRAGENAFRKGIGMSSKSRLEFDVAGFRRFEAELALDDAAGLKGSVVFQVALKSADGDWRTAYESPIVRGGDARIPISIDVKAAQRMALIVDFAERGDECDYADWLAARLIK
jgi:NPCBM/NEW2 domain-containing protein